MEYQRTPKRPNRIEDILRIIDEGLAGSDELQEAYKANFLATDELPEITVEKLS